MAASATSILRIGTLAVVLRHELLELLALPLAGAALLFGVLAMAMAHKAVDGESVSGELSNPFDLRMILRLTLLIALASFVVRAGQTYFGSHGILVLASLGGLADADAVVLSVSRAAGATLPRELAATAVLLAICADIIAKCGFARGLGGTAFGGTYAAGGLGAVGVALALFHAITGLSLRD